jgi:CRP-like cAMP-binding protein
MIERLLKNIGTFPEADSRLFETYVKFRSVPKNTILLNEGDVCDTAFFTFSGASYQFNYIDIDENVIDLHICGEWFLNYASFIAQKPSYTTIKTYADSEILELSLYSIHQLIIASPAFLQLNKIFEQAVSRAYIFDNAMKPLQKYRYLQETKPKLLQTFPLKIIASYLKMTPETLSRVRAVH